MRVHVCVSVCVCVCPGAAYLGDGGSGQAHAHACGRLGDQALRTCVFAAPHVGAWTRGHTAIADESVWRRTEGDDGVSVGPGAPQGGQPSVRVGPGLPGPRRGCQGLRLRLQRGR
jgi:hypothetical protein